MVAERVLAFHASLVLSHAPDGRASLVITIKSTVPSMYDVTPALDDSSFVAELVKMIDETAIRLRYRALDNSRR